MEITERLKRLDNDKLIDVIKNYKRYGYDDDIRNTAITIWGKEDMQKES